MHHLEVVSTERTQTQEKTSPPQVDQQPTVGLPNKSRPGDQTVTFRMTFKKIAQADWEYLAGRVSGSIKWL